MRPLADRGDRAPDRVQGQQGGLLVAGQVLEDGGRGDLRVALPERPHQLDVVLLAPRVLVRIRIGWGRLDPDPQEHVRREQHHVELVSAFRQRDPEVASAAVLQHLARNEQTALLALEPVANTDPDSADQ